MMFLQSFLTKDAQKLFPVGGKVFVRVQRSDGRVWRLKPVPSNATHVLSEGYLELLRESGLSVGTVIYLHRVEPDLFVFTAP